MRILIAIFFVLFQLGYCVSPPYADEFETVFKLREACQSNTRMDNGTSVGGDYISSGFCIGMIIAYVDSYQTFSGLKMCFQNYVKVGQVVEIIKKAMEADPVEWNKPAAFFVYNVLMKNFPCVNQ